MHILHICHIHCTDHHVCMNLSPSRAILCHQFSPQSYGTLPNGNIPWPFVFFLFQYKLNYYYWITVQNRFWEHCNYIGVRVGGREPNISWNDNLETYPWLTDPWQKFHALKIGLGTRHLFIHRKLESFSPFPSLDSKLLSREVFEGLLVNWTHIEEQEATVVELALTAAVSFYWTLLIQS